MNRIGIIGGMGPYAGANYLQCFLEECTAILRQAANEVADQSYPPHYLFQYPVADRTAALLQGPDAYDAVLDELAPQLNALQSLGVAAAAIACNTAHAWHAGLRNAVPGIELLHIADTVADALSWAGVDKVCLLATTGTVRSGMYTRALESQLIDCIEPSDAELAILMSGIYSGVKPGRIDWAQSCFAAAVDAMSKRTGVTAFLMACTEIPLALDSSRVADTISLWDPTRISARRLAQIGLG